MKIQLTPEEITILHNLIKDIVSRYDSVEDENFLNNVCIYAQEVPRRIRTFLNDFRLHEPEAGYCIVSGYPIDAGKIGATPAHWQLNADVSQTLEEQILLTLYGSLMGDLIGWATQQDGKIIHNVFPVKKYEKEQIGLGSVDDLLWHTEDSFHPFRADWIGLLFLRNPDHVPTTIGYLDISQLTKRQIEILMEKRFTIRPDGTHSEENESEKRKEERSKNHGKDNAMKIVDEAYEKIHVMDEAPEKIAVLFGDPAAPYLRIDPYFMDRLEGDEEAQEVLDLAIRLIEDSLHEVVAQPGDCILIDNYKVVHGRKGFKANYDGTDRWFKRVNIARDLRKSRASRISPTSRVIV